MNTMPPSFKCGFATTFIRIFLALFLISVPMEMAHSAILAAGGTLTDVQVGSTYDYTVTLTNEGSISINTFWYAWVPGQDYLPSSPTNIASPTGWTETVTHSTNPPSDGYAIQWHTLTTGTDALAPGTSFQFTFDMTNTPASLAGNSVFYTNTPVGTSFIYSGQPFSGSSQEFVVQSVPEPTSVVLIGLGLLAILGIRPLLAFATKRKQ